MRERKLTLQFGRWSGNKEPYNGWTLTVRDEEWKVVARFQLSNDDLADLLSARFTQPLDTEWWDQ